MSSNQDIFQRLDTNITSKVKLGNGAFIKENGKGSVPVDFKRGVKHINNVLFVLDLAQNLLSVGQLVKNGYGLWFKDNCCKIYDNIEEDKVIAKVEMESTRNFPLRLHFNAFKTESADDSWLWHKSYCHLNFHGLKLLKEKKMVEGLPEIQINVNSCESCIMEKQHRAPFPKGKSWRASAPFELIHFDICGPMRTTSLGQHSIKIIRSDRRGEYTSQELKRIEKMKEFGNNSQQVTLQQNGVAERKNRTIFEMARTVINEKGLPKTFWAVAVDIAVDILNRCPTKSVRNKTPYEAWTELKPSVSHFKVFGCICYAHIPAEKRTKFDEKSEKCIFIGYSSDTKDIVF
ncbi:UNVERIFIED_CONTAM: Retrovirus-related Pol polyprotein from transposon TNT 1-94 [Sesamum latifolium]|uniref:Retrovirus-related Pol polyprotein from transposon TNT 1-94 n=1 Tax=Sesamum latifolium TaxID=2727402 RepID=A0AAW2XAK9_9LAMI